MTQNNGGSVIAELIDSMLTEQVPYLSGCIELLALRDEAGIYVNDPDFVAFVAVQQAIYDLPVDTQTQDWVSLAKKNYSTEYHELDHWAKELTLTHCKALKIRYGRHR